MPARRSAMILAIGVGLAFGLPTLAAAEQWPLAPQGGGSDFRDRDDRDNHHHRDRDWRDHDRHDHDRDRRSGRDRDRHHRDRDGWQDDGWDRRDRGWSYNDRRDWGRRHDRGPKIVDGWQRHHDRSDFYGDGGLPDHLDGLGTYSGDLSASRDRHNGNYFYVDRNGRFDRDDATMGILTGPGRRGPSIIGIAPDGFESVCDRRGGVCVIRPD